MAIEDGETAEVLQKQEEHEKVKYLRLNITNKVNILVQLKKLYIKICE